MEKKMDKINIEGNNITIGEAIGGKEGFIKFNYTKMKERIKRCSEEKDNQKCKRELQDLGIEFIE
jgi:hypothetical protein